jgi:hypothetical protein
MITTKCSPYRHSLHIVYLCQNSCFQAVHSAGTKPRAVEGILSVRFAYRYSASDRLWPLQCFTSMLFKLDTHQQLSRERWSATHRTAAWHDTPVPACYATHAGRLILPSSDPDKSWSSGSASCLYPIMPRCKLHPRACGSSATMHTSGQAACILGEQIG